MFFDLKAENLHSYKLLTSLVLPRPIAWVSSMSANGLVNAAPFSFFNALSGNPPIIALGIGSNSAGAKHTAQNIERENEFVVNLVSYALADRMNISAYEFPAEQSELEYAGLATSPSVHINTPRISASPASLECTLWQKIPVTESNAIYLAHVVGAHVIDEAVSDPERAYFDANKLDTIARLHGADWYTRASDTFKMPRHKNKPAPVTHTDSDHKD